MSYSSNIPSSSYHSVLRISALLVALALIFESGLLSPATQSIVHTAGQQFATAIEATNDNATYDEEALTLVRNDNVTTSATTPSSLSEVTFLLATSLFILLLLIVLNYILHYLRGRESLPQVSRG